MKSTLKQQITLNYTNILSVVLYFMILGVIYSISSILLVASIVVALVLFMGYILTFLVYAAKQYMSKLI